MEPIQLIDLTPYLKQGNIMYAIEAHLLQRQGLYQEALHYLNCVLAIDSLNIKALEQKSSILLQLKQYNECISCCELGLIIDPQCQFYLNKGLALSQLGNYKEIILLSKEAEMNGIKQPVLFNNKAYALNNLNRPEEAIEECKKALNLDQQRPMVHCNYAQALSKLGRYDEAIQRCHKALQVNKGTSLAYSISAFCLFKQDKIDEALTHCQKAIQTSQKNQNAYLLLGEILLLKQQFGGAQECFEKALLFNRVDPDSYRLPDDEVFRVQNQINTIKDQKQGIDQQPLLIQQQ